MSARRLAELFADLAPVPDPEHRVSALCLDSRDAVPGSLFLACQGLTGHGLAWLEQALARGASVIAWQPAVGISAPSVPDGVLAFPVADLAHQVGVVASRFHGQPSHALSVFGVTGTNGKTSVSQLLAQALDADGARCGVLGTLGYGLWGRLEPGPLTTPDALRLQSLLAGFRDQGADYAALEVSSHALDQGRVGGVRFAVAAFTNLTRDHLDYHGDLAQYAAAKRRLFESEGLAHAVINAGDAVGREFLAALRPEVAGIAYALEAADFEGVSASARVYARHIELGDRGLVIEVDGDLGRGTLSSRLLGRFNAANLLAVLASLVALRMPFARALALLGDARTVPGRMECFGGGDAPLAVVDYAHTPDALAQVLRAARGHCRGRLTCVFGCGGDRDQGKRALMGELAAALADRVIVTDDNPRTEDPDRIVAQVLAGMPERQHVSVERDRARAISQALDGARAGDVVLVAGKGHEDYQIVGTNKLPFSDRELVARLLGGVAA